MSNLKSACSTQSIQKISKVYVEYLFIVVINTISTNLLVDHTTGLSWLYPMIIGYKYYRYKCPLGDIKPSSPPTSSDRRGSSGNLQSDVWILKSRIDCPWWDGDFVADAW